MAVPLFYKIMFVTFAFGTFCYVIENVWMPSDLKLVERKREDGENLPRRLLSIKAEHLELDGQLTITNASKLLQYYINKVVQKNFKIELKSVEAFTEEILNIFLFNQTRLRKDETFVQNNGGK